LADPRMIARRLRSGLPQRWSKVSSERGSHAHFSTQGTRGSYARRHGGHIRGNRGWDRAALYQGAAAHCWGLELVGLGFEPAAIPTRDTRII